jgi:hypothetical protein
MKYIALYIMLLGLTFSGHSQTVENIQVVQDGENLKITYRIGASTAEQLYSVFLSCSMDGGSRFEPKAVIGDVGENISGGKSFNTVIWDVFADVDEVVNPEFFVRVELVSDLSPVATRSQDLEQEAVKEEPTQQPIVFESTIEEEPSGLTFDRNGFFSFNFVSGLGIPFGISFGSLNNWGYYVTPMRFAVDTYEIYHYDSYYGQYVTENEVDFNYMLAAGVTKHFVSAGFYRLHGYWGLGSHIYGANLAGVTVDPTVKSHLMLETGIVNVLGGFNITLGLSYSIGYIYAMNFVFGAGFVF